MSEIRVCLITAGQPSSNPRLVKEADALTEVGYTVHAICADCGLWPSKMDTDLMARRGWTYEYAATNAQSFAGRLRRLRHRAARAMCHRMPVESQPFVAATSHVAPELMRSAMRFPAELYIAHHVIALPAAVRAASRFAAKIGYDVEDLYTRMGAYAHRPKAADRFAERIEKRYLRRCDYVTAAAPGFADEYEKRYGIPRPSTVLNVFPLSERPTGFRRSEMGEPLRLYWFSQCIGENRGLEDVVRAMGILRGLHIELHLRGDWQSGYRERLFGLVASVGVDPKRVIAHEPAPPNQMIGLASEYDVGLALEQPVDENKTLCVSNKVFIYLMAGNALAITGLPGQREIAERLENAALLYNPGDIETLATGIQGWYADRISLNAARQRAWQWGAETYNWDIEKSKFLKVVHGVLGQPRKDEYFPAADNRVEKAHASVPG